MDSVLSKNIMIEQNPSSKENPITVHKFRFHSEGIDESSARSSDEPRRAVFPDTESIVDWYALQAPLRIPMTYSDLKDEYQKLLTNYQNLVEQCRVQEFKAVQALERQVASMSTQLAELAERHQAEHTRQEEFLQIVLQMHAERDTVMRSWRRELDHEHASNARALRNAWDELNDRYASCDERMKQLEFGVRQLVTSQDALVEWSERWDMTQDESIHKSTRLHEKMRSVKALCMRIAEEQRYSAVRWLDFRECEQRVQLESSMLTSLTLLQENLRTPEKIYRTPTTREDEWRRERTPRTPKRKSTFDRQTQMGMYTPESSLKRSPQGMGQWINHRSFSDHHSGSSEGDMPSGAKVQPGFRRDVRGEVTDLWEGHPARKTRRGKRGGRQKRIGGAIAMILKVLLGLAHH